MVGGRVPDRQEASRSNEVSRVRPWGSQVMRPLPTRLYWCLYHLQRAKTPSCDTTVWTESFGGRAKVSNDGHGTRVGRERPHRLQMFNPMPLPIRADEIRLDPIGSGLLIERLSCTFMSGVMLS